MADRTSLMAHKRKSIGDVAVDGLFAGMTAGLAMAAVLLVLGLVSGASVTETLGRFDPGSSRSAVVGALLHLAVSGLYGSLFALVYRPLRGRLPVLDRAGWLGGVAYGLALWLGAQLVLLPGLNAGLIGIAPWQFAVGHVVYGAILAYALERHTVG